MNKPIYLIPFIFLYNMVIFVFKTLLKGIKFFNVGLFFTIYIFATILVSALNLFFKGVAFTLVLLYRLLRVLFYYFDLGLFVSSRFIYRIFRYLSYIFYKLVYYIYCTYLLICYFVYKVFRYEIFGILFPIIFIFIKLSKISDTIEQRKLDKINSKNKVVKEQNLLIQEENKKRLEEKRREDAALKLARKEEKQKKQMLLKEARRSRNIGDVLTNLFNKFKLQKKDITRQALLLDYQSKDAEKTEKKKMYKYIARNPEGKIVKGYFPAYSKVEVHSFLLSEGNEVYFIENNKWLDLLYGDGKSYNRKKIKTKDLIFFTTQLSTYIKAGIPLVDALKILSRQFKNRTYSRIFRSVVYDLSTGDSFSTAMDKQGDAFPRLFINMVKTSEMTGELPEVLDDMADYFTATDQTRKQMITAMTYPAIIFVLSIAAIIFIMVYVVPKFVGIYDGIDGAELPGITVFVMNASNFLQNNYLYLILGIIVFIGLFIYLYKNVKAFKSSIQWILMHLPVFKNVIIYNEVTMFTKTLSSLLAHNVYITDSMDILNKITNNEVYKDLIYQTIENLSRGEKISLAFENHWAFPMPAAEMIKTGEMTGQLPEMMTKVSEYYQELHRNAVTRIKTFIEPALILFLTVIVGGIVLSIVIPMFSIYDAMGV